jgi:hypothetical protein
MKQRSVNYRLSGKAFAFKQVVKMTKGKLDRGVSEPQILK